MELPVNSFALSFTGRRNNNEDFYLQEEIAPGIHVYGVADGMGGANAGEVASRMSVQMMIEFLSDELEDPGTVKKSELKSLLETGFKKVQKGLEKAINENKEYQGMGTTFTILLIYYDVYVWASLGDTRLYLLSEDEMQLLTKDHTYVQDFIDQGNEIPNEEFVQKYGSYLLRSLDGGDSEPDIFPVDKDFEILNQNSCFLICSDGLITEKVNSEHDEFASIISGTADLKQAGEQLISSAYFTGSTDNITICLIEIGKIQRNIKGFTELPYPPESIEMESNNKMRIKRKRVLFPLLGIILSVFIIAAVLILWKSSKKSPDRDSVLPLISAENDKPLMDREVLNMEPKKDFRSDYRKNRKIKSISPWIPFEKEDYDIPLSDSTYIVWQPFNDIDLISGYLIKVYHNNKMISEHLVAKEKTSIKVSQLELPEKGIEYVYELVIHAIQDDGKLLPGNKLNFQVIN